MRAPLASSVRLTVGSCVWLSKARLSVVQVVTGQDDLTFNKNVAAFTVFKALGTERNRP